MELEEMMRAATREPRSSFPQHTMRPLSSDLASPEIGDDMVMFQRPGKPPLRFRGRRLTRHARDLTSGMEISIELWRQRNGGLVMSYSAPDGPSLSNRAIQVSNLAEATDCLENVCANFQHLQMQTGDDGMLWFVLHMHLCFKQEFAIMVAHVLDDWSQHPQLQELC